MTELTEAVGDFAYDGIFSPLADLWDAQAGAFWVPVGGTIDSSPFAPSSMYDSEAGRAMMRGTCRELATENAYAINACENMISYVVGTGMQAEIEPRRKRDDLDSDLDDDVTMLAEQVLAEIDQEELVFRAMTDGEVFIRRFPRVGQTSQYRFVEPCDVTAGTSSDEDESYGIVAKEGDVLSPEYYLIREDSDDEPVRVEAKEIIHIKWGVRSNVKRGVPLLWAVRYHLLRAVRNLSSGSQVVGFQASWGAVRYHTDPVRGAMKGFADRRADGTVSNPFTSRQERVAKYSSAARILDLPASVKMEFPATGVAVDKITAMVQAELRAAAARLVMPEYMLTSDASNGNYSSTLVAEGPPYKMFKRQQAKVGRALVKIIEGEISAAQDDGRLPAGTKDKVSITVNGPEVGQRDPLQLATKNEILFRNGILSAQTWSTQEGLRYAREQRNIDQHALGGTFPEQQPS